MDSFVFACQNKGGILADDFAEGKTDASSFEFRALSL